MGSLAQPLSNYVEAEIRHRSRSFWDDGNTTPIQLLVDIASPHSSTRLPRSEKLICSGRPLRKRAESKRSRRSSANCDHSANEAGSRAGTSRPDISQVGVFCPEALGSSHC